MHSAALAAAVASILLTLRFLVAGLFLRAGASKLADRADFQLAVTNYQIVPAPLVKTAAAAVPAAEVIAGCLLLLGVATSIAGWFLAALLAGFSVVIAVNLSRGRVFDCGCGGTAPRNISWQHVASNLLLAASAAAVALAPLPELALRTGPGAVLSPAVPTGSGVPMVLTAALGIVMAVLLRAVLGLGGHLRTTRKPLTDVNHPVNH
jgi:uncharacterized membrane protein YphA (DoxX/SURF4 family)